jgi:hypothetical protein
MNMLSLNNDFYFFHWMKFHVVHVASSLLKR